MELFISLDITWHTILLHIAFVTWQNSGVLSQLVYGRYKDNTELPDKPNRGRACPQLIMNGPELLLCEVYPDTEKLED